MRISRIMLFSIFAAFVSVAYGHGEDVPGPHGGHIRMPGAFHTEVVINEQPNELQIYLLDINWKNPSTKDSSVNVVHKINTIEENLICKKMVDYFSCVAKKETSFKTGALLIRATREGLKGNIATYELPLQFAKSQQDSHSGHH